MVVVSGRNAAMIASQGPLVRPRQAARQQSADESPCRSGVPPCFPDLHLSRSRQVIARPAAQGHQVPEWRSIYSWGQSQCAQGRWKLVEFNRDQGFPASPLRRPAQGSASTSATSEAHP